MIPPFDRAKLARRNRLDDAEALAGSGSRSRSPSEGMLETVEMSELVRALAGATGVQIAAPDDLEQKARLYVLPLKAAAGG